MNEEKEVLYCACGRKATISLSALGKTTALCDECWDRKLRQAGVRTGKKPRRKPATRARRLL